MYIEYCYGPKWPYLIYIAYIGLFGTSICRFVQVLYLGRAPRTKETLPDFREKCRVTRHSRVFHGLTGSQRTPGRWGVTYINVYISIYLYIDISISIYRYLYIEIYIDISISIYSVRAHPLALLRRRVPPITMGPHPGSQYLAPALALGSPVLASQGHPTSGYLVKSPLTISFASVRV